MDLQATLQLCGGKRSRGAPINAAAPRDKGSGDLLYVVDAKSKLRYLIDGGAFLSIIPPTPEQRAKGPNEVKLQAANGSPIECFGTTHLNIHLGAREFPFTVTIADVNNPILGSDFLAHFYLAPNHKDGTLINLEDFSTIDVGIETTATPIRINFVNQYEDPFYKLLDSFPDLTNPSFKPDEPKHGVKHHIPTTGPPIQSKARRLAPDKLATAKAELDKLEKIGIARRAKSEWASPLLVTGKADGSLRVCGDYRRLNTVTTDDKYPVKQLSDFNANLAGKKIFSKIDLLKGYHQIPVAPEDVCKTGVITPFGLFVFPRTPFGLKNAGSDFQRMMDAILGDIPHVFVYIDDILVASETPEEHLHDLARVFKILADNGLVVNRAKCVLGQTSLEFLGYMVDANGISPLEDRVAAIRETTPPTTVKELQRFLGVINYYRRFIKNAAGHAHHLFKALAGKPKVLKWTFECQMSFEALKGALAAATLLHHPRKDAQLALTADASKIAIGAVLEQRGPRGWEPLGFFSAKLTEQQGLWPPFDRELLASFRSIRHFRHMVEGRSFVLYTDHNSLVPALRKKAEPHTARQTYQLSVISEFTTDLRYIEGKANVVADALSRPNDTRQQPLVESILTESRQVNESDRNNSASDSRGATSHNSGSDSRGATSHNSDFDYRGATSHNSGFDSRGATSQNSRGANQPRNSSSLEAQPIHGNPLVKPNPETRSPPNATSNVTTPISAINRPVETEKTEDCMAVIMAIGQIGVDMTEMAREQPLDADFHRLSNDARSGLNFRKVDVGNGTLLVDVSNGPARAWVPQNWRRRVFDAVHGLGHPGVHRTQQTVAAKFVWPNMRADVANWARQCIPCQREKITRNTSPPIGHFEVPSKRFTHLHADLVMMPISNGFPYLLTIIDRMTRWPTAIPLRDITAESVIDGLAHGWISQFGLPAAITTDRGTQFTSNMWEQLLRSWGIQHHQTTAYHPESNGMVERFHRRLKESLMALAAESRDKWFWQLPCALLAVRTTLKPDIGASPADLVFGEGIAVPGDLLGSHPAEDRELQRQRRELLANMRFEVTRLQPTPTSAHRQPHVHIPNSLEDATHVFIRRGGVHPPLTAPYDGPFRIEKRTTHNVTVHRPGGGTETIALARIKPAHIAADGEEPATAEPPPPGQLPRPRTRLPRPRPRSQQNAQTAGQQKRRRQRVPNIDEFGAPPSHPCPPPPPRPPSPSRPQDQALSFDDWLAQPRDERQHEQVIQPPDQPNQPSASRPAASESTSGDATPANDILTEPEPQAGRRRRPNISALSALIREHLSPTTNLISESSN